MSTKIAAEFRLIVDSNEEMTGESTIDLLADKVQSLLGKTIAITTNFDDSSVAKNPIRSVDSSKIEGHRPTIQPSSKIPNEKLSTNFYQTDTTAGNNVNPSQIEEIVPSSITELIMNNDEFDDLTEYHPIQLKSSNPKRIPQLRDRDLCDHENLSTLSFSEPENRLSDIIFYHKKFLNNQINHLRKLDKDLMRIERYYKMKKFNRIESKQPLINYSEDKNYHHNHENDKNTHHYEYIPVPLSNRNVVPNDQPGNHGNKVVKIRHKTTTDDDDQPKPNDKADQILRTSIRMIRKIDLLLNMNYDLDLTSKSVQTSIVDNHVHRSQVVDDNSADCHDRLKSLSWFLNFNGDHYRIEPSANVNLPEIFEKNCQDFKLKSMMRSIRIKDNTRLRMETVDQRREEIVQVYLMKNTCPNVDQTDNNNNNNNNGNRKFHSRSSNGPNRPLSPIKRRVFTHRQMRSQTEKLYRKLPEVKAKMNSGKREDDARRRRMMAEIFKQKLKNHAVRGKLNWPITSQAISA